MRPRSADNGKVVCGVRTLLQQQQPCVVYSFGCAACRSATTAHALPCNPVAMMLVACRSGGFTSFEEDLIQAAPHCEVHIFDGTLLPWYQLAVTRAVPAATLHDYGLGATDQDVSSNPACSCITHAVSPPACLTGRGCRWLWIAQCSAGLPARCCRCG